MRRVRLGLVIGSVSLLVLHCSGARDRSAGKIRYVEVYAGAAGQPQVSGAIPDRHSMGGAAGGAGVPSGAGQAGVPGAGVPNSSGGNPPVTGGAGTGGVPTTAVGGTTNTGGAAQSSGGTGSSGMGGTRSTGGSGTGGAATVCQQCQRSKCQCLVDACTVATGNAAAGPAKGQPKSTLCKAMIDCANTTQCAKGSLGSGEGCYCGTASTTDCISGMADGPCKSQAESAAESTGGLVIGQRWVNPGYAMGFAGTFIRCTLQNCNYECYGTGTASGGPSTVCSGSGGSPGAGGTGGTPSAGGAGGTAAGGGTGGSGASGGTLASGGSGATGGTVSSGGAGATGGTGGTTGATGGANGSGGSGGIIPPGTCVPPTSCYVDLNTNGSSDCSESLLSNSQFSMNVNGWPSGFLTDSQWNSNGPNSCSGSIATTVSTGLYEGGTQQCVTVIASQSYNIRAQYFVDPSQSPSTQASLTVSAYTNSNCLGNPIPSAGWIGLGSTKGSWLSLGQNGILMPGGAQSVLVGLHASRDFSTDSPSTVLWDNVLLIKQ